MQLSNEPAEELANYVVASSKGAFELVGFVSGGASMFMRIHTAHALAMSLIRGDLRL